MPSQELRVAIQKDFKNVWTRLSAYCKEQNKPHYTGSIGARGTLHVQLLEKQCDFSIIDATLPKNAIFVSKAISIVPHMHNCEKELANVEPHIRQKEINAAANMIETELLDLAKTNKYNIVHETDCDNSAQYYENLFRALVLADYKLALMCVAADQATRNWIFTDLHQKNRTELTQAEFLNCDNMLDHLCDTCFKFPLTNVYWMTLDNDKWAPNFSLIAQYNGISAHNVQMLHTDDAKQKFGLFQQHIADELNNSTKRTGITEAELQHLTIRNKSSNDWIKSWKLPGKEPKISSAPSSPALKPTPPKNLLSQELLTAFAASKSGSTKQATDEQTIISELISATNVSASSADTNKVPEVAPFELFTPQTLTSSVASSAKSSGAKGPVPSRFVLQ